MKTSCKYDLWSEQSKTEHKSISLPSPCPSAGWHCVKMYTVTGSDLQCNISSKTGRRSEINSFFRYSWHSEQPSWQVLICVKTQEWNTLLFGNGHFLLSAVMFLTVFIFCPICMKSNSMYWINGRFGFVHSFICFVVLVRWSFEIPLDFTGESHFGRSSQVLVAVVVWSLWG